ncbi:MAG: hypothetical protein HY717_11615 [Planctomycetes bacterium]|nr:hypothetical protein [Planctomycetota bacterium]
MKIQIPIPKGYLLALAFSSGALALAQESPIEKAAASGKVKILQAEEKPVSNLPDLIIFKAGRVTEVRGLKIQGEEVEYQAQALNGIWRRERRSKSQIQSILIGKTLAEYRAEISVRPTPQPRAVESARQQPARHEEVVAGKFTAQQGRFTRWTFTFNQELNKYYPFAEEATEYGTFKIRSHYLKPVGRGDFEENEVIAKGKYFLYAPGVFGNQDWVLNLSNVTYTENDIAPKSSLYTERLSDEVFIVKFAPDRKVFHLEWANQGGWQWTSPTQQTFYRVVEPAKLAGGGGGSSAADKKEPDPKEIEAALVSEKRS